MSDTAKHVGLRLRIALRWLAIILVLPTPARAQCPFTQQYTWGCDEVLPPQQTEIEEDIGNEDDGWADSFNHDSAGCRSLKDGWDDAIEDGRVWYTDDLFPATGKHGWYHGNQDGSGQILLDVEAFGDEFDVDAARTAIHEVAHDLGCDDTQANQWAAYCVQYSGAFPPPPQEQCNGM